MTYGARLQAMTGGSATRWISRAGQGGIRGRVRRHQRDKAAVAKAQHR